MSTLPAAIVLESVSKRYGARTIIHDVSFTVARGEIVGFLGPNGAGKTTTLRIIAGFTAATAGRVTVAGFDMATHNVEAAGRIGYVPERPPLYDVLDVATFLRFVAKAKGIPRPAIAAELERVVSACQLASVFRREIYKLSKGFRQRLGLAQGMLGKPEVLLLDEPTAGLDPGQIQETREVIRALGAEHAVLFSTHILAEATLLCRRVAIINQGRLLAIDAPAALERAMEQTNRVTLRVSAPAPELRDELLSLKGVIDVEIAPSADDPNMLAVDCQVEAGNHVEAAIARAVTRRWALHRLDRQHSTLENVFLRYVKDTQRV